MNGFAPSNGSRSAGFALLIVLWMVVLIAFIITHVTVSGHSELRIAGNLANNVAAQAGADGAIYEAIFNLVDRRPESRWWPDGASHLLQIGASRVVVRIENEDSFINPNVASAALLEGLLRAVGVDPKKAVDLAGAIQEWVGSARGRRTPEELLSDYRAAGLDYAPPVAPPRSADDIGAIAPLESIDELGRVIGMSPQVLAALRPHLTLFGPGVPAAEYVDPIVAAAMAFAGIATTSGVSTNPEFMTARIHATAQGPGNAEVTRTAVARIGTVAARGYSLLTWGNGLE